MASSFRVAFYLTNDLTHEPVKSLHAGRHCARRLLRALIRAGVLRPGDGAAIEVQHPGEKWAPVVGECYAWTLTQGLRRGARPSLARDR